MARTEYELQMDILKKDLERKEREVHRYKNEVENMNEIINEKEMTFEIKRHKDYQIIEKLQEQVHELKIQNQTLLTEKKGVEKENKLLQMKYEDEKSSKCQAEEVIYSLYYYRCILINYLLISLTEKLQDLSKIKRTLKFNLRSLQKEIQSFSINLKTDKV